MGAPLRRGISAVADLAEIDPEQASGLEKMIDFQGSVEVAWQ